LYKEAQHVSTCKTKPLLASWLPHPQVDWSPISSMVVSGGEDCKYKVRPCL